MVDFMSDVWTSGRCMSRHRDSPNPGSALRWQERRNYGFRTWEKLITRLCQIKSVVPEIVCC